MQDYTRGALELRTALQLAPGHAGAAFHLGSILAHGQMGAPPDYFSARDMLRIAAGIGATYAASERMSGGGGSGVDPAIREAARVAFEQVDAVIRAADAEVEGVLSSRSDGGRADL